MAPPIVDLEQAAIEPATAVARAVTPSVVRISTGFGQGSGIIWDAANGYIVTNDHVTDTADTVSVLLHNGVEVSGVVIGGDAALTSRRAGRFQRSRSRRGHFCSESDGRGRAVGRRHRLAVRS